jgi:hypothetical protein
VEIPGRRAQDNAVSEEPPMTRALLIGLLISLTAASAANARGHRQSQTRGGGHPHRAAGFVTPGAVGGGSANVQNYFAVSGANAGTTLRLGGALNEGGYSRRRR